MRGACLLCVLLACVDPGAVSCPDGRVCPEGLKCAVVAAPSGDRPFCVARSQLGCTDGEMCGGGASTCHSGVCLPNECGNELLDIGEACDKGDAEDGGGCSATCTSTEICGNGIVDPSTGEQCDRGTAGLSSDGCTSRCNVEALVWTDVAPKGIRARAYGAMANDASGNVVLFGGLSETQILGDTWQWFDDHWRQRIVIASPPARADHAMAYDRERNRFVLFGGYAGGGNFSDTWTFDGTTWTEQHPTTSPPARKGHAMAYDPVRKRVVLFGGYAYPVSLTDTWEWDGANWTAVTVSSSPPGGANMLLAYDAARAETVYFRVGQTSGETWIWKNGAWSQPTIAGASPDVGDALAFDSSTNEVVLYTGAQDGETWTWNGSAWQLRAPTDPTPSRYGTALAFDASSQSLLMFGGFAGNPFPLDETWAWKNGNWTKLPPPAPSPPARGGHVMVYNAGTGQIVLHGGGTRTTGGIASALFDDTWLWQESTWSKLTAQGSTPPARTNHAMAYDSYRGEMVMFGGGLLVTQTAGAPVLGDTWEMIGKQWFERTPATSPSARRSAAMAFDARARKTILFGGSDGSTAPGSFRNDTWTWDGDAWAQLDPATSPPGREGASIAYDAVRERVVLFGGVTALFLPVVIGDTWEWDGVTWTQKFPATSPPARMYATMYYNPDRQRVVLLSGVASDGPYDDEWEWDGSTWTRLVPSGPVRSRHHGAYDSVEHRLISFGGFGIGISPPVDETWSLQYTTPIDRPERCLARQLDEDGDMLAGCDDPDCWARCTPMCPPGTSCDLTLPRCGDGICTQVERGFCAECD